jgi:glycosyltransferase involved in cell wall biosynthesis
MDSPLQLSEQRSISVVTPVYNREGSVAELCRRLAEVLPRIAVQHEIILVNDGSRDRSWHVISELSSRSKAVRGLNLMRNYGQHNALLYGIRAAKYDVIVTMDDDLQHPPEEIPRLLARLEEGFDVVYGAPKTERNRVMRTLFGIGVFFTSSSAIASKEVYRDFRSWLPSSPSSPAPSFLRSASSEST